MGFLGREALLTKEAFKVEKVVLSVNDKTQEENYVYVREMSAYERDTFSQSLLKSRYNEKNEFIGYEQVMDNYRAKLALATLCDANGNPVFKPQDLMGLATSMSTETMDKIVKAASRINAMAEQDKDAIEKNLEPGQVDNSISDFAG